MSRLIHPWHVLFPLAAPMLVPEYVRRRRRLRRRLELYDQGIE